MKQRHHKIMENRGWEVEEQNYSCIREASGRHNSGHVDYIRVNYRAKPNLNRKGFLH